MKYLFFLFLLTTFFFSSKAQQKEHSFKFKSINNIGILSGENQNKFTLQTINGLQYKSWFAGLGIAIDNYGYRSLPAFADVRKTFGHKQWLPFVYVDAGINFPLYTSNLPRKSGGMDFNKFYNTFYGEAGIGVNKKLNKKLQFTFSIGYSHKHFSYLQSYDLSSALLLAGYHYSSTQYDFYYNRIAIKTGLQFQF